MIFQAALAEKVVAGEKTVTRRMYSPNPRSPWYEVKCAYEVGQVFTVNPGRGKVNVGRARVTSVTRATLTLTDAEARREGCADAAEFATVIKALHGPYDPSTEVWRLEFELVDESDAR